MFFVVYISGTYGSERYFQSLECAIEAFYETLEMPDFLTVPISQFEEELKNKGELSICIEKIHLESRIFEDGEFFDETDKISDSEVGDDFLAIDWT